jgi:hypothetical protein
MHVTVVSSKRSSLEPLLIDRRRPLGSRRIIKTVPCASSLTPFRGAPPASAGSNAALDNNSVGNYFDGNRRVGNEKIGGPLNEDQVVRKLKPAHGNWVDGDQFWDREVEVALLEEKLRDHAHVLLVAQRRMGKTSLMHEVKRRLQAERPCLFIDLQKAASAEDVIVELGMATRPFKSLWRKTTDLFKNVLLTVADGVDEIQAGELSVKLRGGLLASNWVERGDRLFDILAASEKPVVIFIDELPIFVNNVLKGPDYVITMERRERTERFMSWLRANALRLRGKLSIVVAGSIGLEPVLRQAQLSATLTSFEPFDLGPWSEASAAACLEALAAGKGIELQEGAARGMARKLEYCVPHHVQMFFTAAFDQCRRAGTVRFETAQIDEIYRTHLLSTRGHAELSHYEERLRIVLGKDLYGQALDLLTEAAVSGGLGQESLHALRRESAVEGRDSVEDQTYLLWVLEHDGYLVRSGESYVFQSPLLRNWWKARHEFVFVPVLRRAVVRG